MPNQGIPERSKLHFANLDGLRFVAFALVFLQHGYWSAFGQAELGSPVLTALQNFLFESGTTGVSVFFVLSGYLITYLILAEIELRGRLDVYAFYVRRALRIWPLYFAVISFSLILYPFLKSIMGVGSPEVTRPIFYFLFLSNFDVMNIFQLYPGAGPMSSSATWSVAIEEQFYLIWPLLFLWVPGRRQVWIFVSAILVAIGFRALNIGTNYVLEFHSLSVCGDLAMGGLAAYASLRVPGIMRFCEELALPRRLAAYALGLLVLIAGPPLAGQGYGLIPLRLVSTVFFAFIIMDQNFNKSDKLKLSQSRFMTEWGKYTYGLYLLHSLALQAVQLVPRLLHIKPTGMLFEVLNASVALGVAMGLSYLSYNFLERPFLRIKARYSRVPGAGVANAQLSPVKPV